MHALDYFYKNICNAITIQVCFWHLDCFVLFWQHKCVTRMSCQFKLIFYIKSHRKLVKLV